MSPDTVFDLQVIVHPILEVIGLLIAAFISAYVPRAINALALWAKVKLTDQQRAIMLGAVQTAVGKIETKLDQKALSVAHITIDDPTVRAEAQAAIEAVSSTARALNVTTDGVARMIVGKVDTSVRVEPAVVTVVAPAAPVAPSIISAS